MEKLKPYLTYILVALVLAVTGFYVWQDWNFTKKAENKEEFNQEQTQEPKQEQVTENGVDISGQGEITTTKTSITAPSLNRVVNVTGQISEEAKTIALAKIEEYKKKIQANPSNSENWIILGIYYKTLGDLEGAKEVWEYAKAIDPKNFIPYNNLGDLYGYFLNDKVKAEANFKKALELAPDQAFLYRSVADFYRYVMKDPVKADVILNSASPASIKQ